MGDHGELSVRGVHYGLEGLHPVLRGLVDAFSGRASDIHAFDSFSDEIGCQRAYRFGIDFSVAVIASVKCRNNALETVQIFHCRWFLLSMITSYHRRK
jgi:hypothetical protein